MRKAMKTILITIALLIGLSVQGQTQFKGVDYNGSSFSEGDYEKWMKHEQ